MPMKKSLLPVIAIAIACSTAKAQEWTGAVNSDWNNSANWNEWPLNDEDISIDPAFFTGAMALPVISGTSGFIPDRLFIVNGGQLTIAGALIVGNRVIIEDDGSSVVMESGSLTAERLITEAGGGFTLQDGMVNITSVVALGDDGVSPSYMTMNGGTMTVTGEFGFDVVLEPSSPAFTVNAGSLTVNGEAMWYSEAPGSGRGRLLVNGGDVQINGPMVSNAGGPLRTHIEVNGGTLTTIGPEIDLRNNDDSLIVTSGSIHLGGTMTMDMDGVFHMSGGEVNFMDDVTLDGNGTYLLNDVNIVQNATLTHSDPEEIVVLGDWNSQGSFIPQTNTVAFSGDEQQNIGATTLHGMRVENYGGGLLLLGPVSVSHEVQLAMGIIQTNQSALLTLLDDATITAGSASSHVDGPLRKIGNDDLVFPVGDNGVWRRIGITGLNSESAEFTAEYFNEPYLNTTSLGPAMIEVSDQEYWRLDRTGTIDQPMVKLHWEDAMTNGISDCDGAVVAYWNGSAWLGAPSVVDGDCTGNAAGSVTSEDGVPLFGVFTIGLANEFVGVEQLRSEAPLISYDPRQHLLHVKGDHSERELRLMDIQGKHVHQHRIRTGDTSISLPALTNGVYLVWLEGTHVQRIVMVR